eukprot:scaffold138929_cov133-Phaeocystis_antarctica.AAC.1
MRCAPCRCAVRHAPGLASTVSRVAVPHLRAVTIFGVGSAPSSCSLDALCAMSIRCAAYSWAG